MSPTEARLVQRMQGRIVELEAMQMEYNLLLNYLCEYHGDEHHVFRVHTAKVKLIRNGPIKTEIVDNGCTMEIRRVGKQPPNGKPCILLP